MYRLTIFKKKIELHTEIRKENVDIASISETKIDKRYHDRQFKIDGFNNYYRVDGNKRGGIMMLFMEDLPVKVSSVDKGNERCHVEAILTKTEWLTNYSYTSQPKIIYPHTYNILIGTWTWTHL